MANENNESMFNKIFVGVAISVLTAALLYFFNLDDKPKNYISESTQTKSSIIDNPNSNRQNSGGITEDDIKQKELQLKQRELELKSKQLEEKYSNESSENVADYNLNGNWKGDNGLDYNITQSRNQINMSEYVVLFGSQNVSCYASGLINGNKVNGTAVGLLGQQFNFDMNIINDVQVNFSFMNFNGQYTTINLTKQ